MHLKCLLKPLVLSVLIFSSVTQSQTLERLKITIETKPGTDSGFTRELDKRLSECPYLEIIEEEARKVGHGEVITVGPYEELLELYENNFGLINFYKKHPPPPGTLTSFTVRGDKGTISRSFGGLGKTEKEIMKHLIDKGLYD